MKIENTFEHSIIIANIEIEGEYLSVEFEDESTIEPENEVTIECIFSPMEEGVFKGSIEISTNIINQETVTVPVIGTGIILRPPVVVNPINDVELEEDFEVADLNNVFSDRDDDRLVFTAEAANENIIGESNNNILSLSSAENWHGQFVVAVTADDQTGDDRLMINQTRRGARSVANYAPQRDLTVNLEFFVTVTPVNDAPIVLDGVPDIEVDEDTASGHK